MTIWLGIGLVLAGGFMGLLLASWLAAAGRADEYARGYREGYERGYQDGHDDGRREEAD